MGSPRLDICAWCFTTIAKDEDPANDQKALYHRSCWEEMRTQHEINARRTDPPPHEWDGLTPEEGGEDGKPDD